MHELEEERKAKAQKQLAAAAGLISEAQVERLDWLYEQANTGPTEDEAMNAAVTLGADEGQKQLEALKTTAGSLFLDTATNASQDTLRKLREDPMFAIRQAEYKQQEAIRANPLM